MCCDKTGIQGAIDLLQQPELREELTIYTTFYTMHMIHRPKFIIKISQHFFLDYPIHKHSEKFHFIKFEGKVYERCFWCRIHLWFRYVGGFVRKVDDVTAYLAAKPSRLRAHHHNITTTRWRLCVTMETLWQQQYGGYVVLLLLQMYSTSSTVQS